MKKVWPYLFLLILGLFSLGQLQRIQLTEVVVFYAYDLLIMVWLILSLIKFPQKWQQVLKVGTRNKWLYLALGWILVGWLGVALRGESLLIPILYVTRTLAYASFGLSLSWIQPFSQLNQKKLWILAGLIVAGLGLTQYLALPDTRFIKFLGWDDHYYRLISTQLDPNYTGILLVMTFFLLWGLDFKSKWNTAKTILLMFLTATLLLTYSRASYLSWLATSLLLLLLNIKHQQKINYLLLGLIGLFVVSLPFLPRPGGAGVKLERTSSIQTRVKSSQTTLQQLNSYQWLIGRGAFIPQEINQAHQDWPDTARFADNLEVFIVGSVGVVGLILTMQLLANWGLVLYKKERFIFLAFVAIFIHSQFNHTLFQPFVWLWLSSLGLHKLQISSET